MGNGVLFTSSYWPSDVMIGNMCKIHSYVSLTEASRANGYFLSLSWLLSKGNCLMLKIMQLLCWLVMKRKKKKERPEETLIENPFSFLLSSIPSIHSSSLPPSLHSFLTVNSLFVLPIKSILMLFTYSYTHLGETTINFEHGDRWLSRLFTDPVN